MELAGALSGVLLILSYCCFSVAQSCPTLCDPVDCSPPGSSVHGISQAKILEWVAISFSRGSSRLRSRTHFSCIAGGFFTAEPSGKPAYLEWACLNLWGGTWLMADRDWPLLGHVGSSHVFLISFLGQRAGPGLPFSWWWWGAVVCSSTIIRTCRALRAEKFPIIKVVPSLVSMSLHNRGVGHSGTTMGWWENI